MQTLPIAMLMLTISFGGGWRDGRSPVTRVVAPAASAEHQARKGGKWYFAETGHAVYCYGPVKFLPQEQGGIQRVATVCQGDQPLVPLRD